MDPDYRAPLEDEEADLDYRPESEREPVNEPDTFKERDMDRD